MLDNELHAKTIEVDGQYATIGSDNLDHISWAYNAEAKVCSHFLVCISHA
jgi:phosphatidylserine/phosphatidylglycerophosphate/cardiolipin synthase-like enzyme